MAAARTAEGEMVQVEKAVTGCAGEACVLSSGMCEGDTELIGQLLAAEFADVALEALLPGGGEGVQYDQFFAGAPGKLVPLPRLMAFQATPAEKGATPWYRCTMAQVEENVAKMVYAPWTPTMAAIKSAAEQAAGCTWNLAHIICYRDEKDSMGFHSDTFVDLRRGSKIGVVSLGATREIVLRRKARAGETEEDVQRAELAHNSLFLLDEETNAKWTHGIQKRRQNQVGGPRVAVVLRDSTTFRSGEGLCFGPRCACGTLEEAQAESANEEGQRRVQSDKDRCHRMCELKNIREWDGEGMAAFLRGEVE